MSVRLQRYSKHCQRLIDENDQIIGFANILTNGKWALCDTNGTRLSKAAFDRPRDVAQALRQRLAPKE